jgi:hypothetical protein
LISVLEEHAPFFFVVEYILNKLSELTGYFMLIACLSPFSTLKMEVIHFFRTSLNFFQTKQMTSQKIALFVNN